MINQVNSLNPFLRIRKNHFFSYLIQKTSHSINPLEILLEEDEKQTTSSTIARIASEIFNFLSNLSFQNTNRLPLRYTNTPSFFSPETKPPLQTITKAITYQCLRIIYQIALDIFSTLYSSQLPYCFYRFSKNNKKIYSCACLLISSHHRRTYEKRYIEKAPYPLQIILEVKKQKPDFPKHLQRKLIALKKTPPLDRIAYIQQFKAKQIQEIKKASFENIGLIFLSLGIVKNILYGSTPLEATISSYPPSLTYSSIQLLIRFIRNKWISLPIVFILTKKTTDKLCFKPVHYQKRLIQTIEAYLMQIALLNTIPKHLSLHHLFPLKETRYTNLFNRIVLSAPLLYSKGKKLAERNITCINFNSHSLITILCLVIFYYTTLLTFIDGVEFASSIICDNEQM